MIASTDAELAGVSRSRTWRAADRCVTGGDQSITILTAGHETTANAMTFTLYLLLPHPAEQDLLREEVLRVLGERTEPTIEMLDALPQARWVRCRSRCGCCRRRGRWAGKISGRWSWADFICRRNARF